MYSPKIKEDLISILYKLAKQEGKPMTAGQIHQINNETAPESVKKTADDGGS